MRGIITVILLTMAAGCATYGQGIKHTLAEVEDQNYEKAGHSLEKKLTPDGKDALLFYLEQGTIEHLKGNYEKSNRALEKAHRLADQLRTRSTGDYLAVSMVNPRESTYMGTDFERVYINYYKALNYIMLSQKAPDADIRQAYLESAQVEIRRLDITLSSLSFEKGSYTQVEKEKKGTAASLYKFFNKLHGNWLEEKWLVFREDAYARYLAGCLYEKMGDLDDARIAYQKAAEIYETGYAKQYRLSRDMAELAWFDAIRMMRRLGGWEGRWQNLVREKLPSGARKKLRQWRPDKAQIVVVQHLGLIPQRRELNLHLRARPDQHALCLDPVPTGSPTEIQDELAWFFLLYGDMGLLDMLHAYSQDGLLGVADRVTHKTFFLGPAWQTAEELNVIQALGGIGIRVAVPYYSPLRSEINSSNLVIDEKQSAELTRAESLSQIAIQEQLHNAGHDLRAALSRAILKNTLLYRLGESAGGQLGALVGKIISFLTTAAETRNWLCLPYEVRLTRQLVDPGEHTMRLTTHTESGRQVSESEHTVTLAPGEIRLWVQRTMDVTQKRVQR